MAMIRCSECKAKISDRAAACPSCGAPITVAAARKTGGPTSKLGIGCVGLLVLAGLGAVIGGSKTGSVADNVTGNAAAAKAAEDIQSKRGTMAGLAAASLKRAARDPDSLKIERAFTTMDAKLACIRYRARNGFGGMNREHVVFSEAGGDPSARAWNKYCVNGEFSEQTPNAETLMGVIGG